MDIIKTDRLRLTPFSSEDFNLFVNEMLTDPLVIEFFYSYQKLKDSDEIRKKATIDFWDHFEESRRDYGLEIWAGRIQGTNAFIGWSGLLQTELSDKYGGPELQYMLAANAHGKGYATEFAKGVLKHAEAKGEQNAVIATIDIPNKVSIRVIEKLGFENEGQIEAYGSTEMYLFRKNLN